MRKITIAVHVLLVALLCAQAHAACPPAGRSKAEWFVLKDAGFRIDDAKQRNPLALSLLDCLGSSDPQWRDGIAFSALSTWIAAGALDKQTATTIHGQLLAQLDPESADKGGFRKPFSALVLAALVAADRDKRLLDNDAFALTVERASTYFETIRDYRGYDARSGWRHAVAHGADLLTQLAVHPRTSNVQVDRIMAALETQIAPQGGHFYIYGEPERMALPVFHIAQRGLYSAEEWQEWFNAIAAIPEDGSLFDSQPGLSRRHNLQALLLILHVNASEADDDVLRSSLLVAVSQTLRALQ